MNAPRNTERDLEIAALRDGGITYKAIGERYGISHWRVAQICERHRRNRKLRELRARIAERLERERLQKEAMDEQSLLLRNEMPPAKME